MYYFFEDALEHLNYSSNIFKFINLDELVYVSNLSQDCTKISI